MDFSATSLDTEVQRTVENLPVARGAAYYSQAEGDSPRCLPGTRVELLDQIKGWVQGSTANSVFWLNGQAGTGKSTITRTVADVLSDRKYTMASFFFKRGEGDRGSLGKFFTTIAWQLAKRQQELARHIKEALDEHPGLADSGLALQFDKLILGPYQKEAAARQGKETRPIVILIDALDECQPNGGTELDEKVRLVIKLFLRARSLGLKVFITSRPELPIRLEFLSHRGLYNDVALHELPPNVAEKDISMYLHHELDSIRSEWNSAVTDASESLALDWPSQTDFTALVTMAVPLFIFASTVCRFMREFRFGSPYEHLKEVLDLGSKTPELGLEATYIPILNRLVAGLRPTRRTQIIEKFGTIIGTVINLASPLSISALAVLLDLPLPEVRRHLDNFHSVLNIPSSSTEPIHLLHLSFRDFLVQSEREDQEFWVNESDAAYNIFLNCIRVMEENLKEDICELQWPGTKISAVDPEHVSRRIPRELWYACVYWPYHLQQSQRPLNEGLIYSFLSRRFLHWIEVLALTAEKPLQIFKQTSDLIPSLVSACPIHSFVRALLIVSV